MVYFLTHKGDVEDMLQDFIRGVEGEPGRNLKRLHMDSRGEFLNEKWKTS